MRPKVKKSLSGTLNRSIITLIIVVLAAFTCSIFFILSNERREYEISTSEGILRTLSDSITSSISNYSQVSRLIITDDRLVMFLRADAVNIDMGMINDARYGVLDILYVTEGADCVIVVRDDMIMMATDRISYTYDHEKMDNEEWRKDIINARGRAVIMFNGNGASLRNDGKPVITIAREINDVLTQQRTGIMLLNISSEVFSLMLKNLDYNNICIEGLDGTFIAGDDQIGRRFSYDVSGGDIQHKTIEDDNGKWLVSACRAGDLPIAIIRMAPYGTAGMPYGVIYVLVFLMLFLLAAVLFFAGLLTRKLTRPVNSFSKLMDKNRQSGELTLIETDPPYRELNMLKDGYNNLVVHVKDLIAALMDNEKNLREAEMRVLNEQIKPHFLYNSLETIGFLALDAGADNVHDALETLGSFYRDFLSKGSAEIPLSKEVHIVKDYLSLLKLRYGDIIEDEYDISPNTGNYIVPKLILQPLVENSVYHGIRQKGEKGTIKISSTLSNGRLHIKVMDTGVGMTEDKIKELVSVRDDDDEKRDDKSFGLWDTISRIRNYCGTDDVVEIRSEPGEYTEVELIISSGSSRR
ncbi:MAG: histidine kinase [Lachnospiraceae bacterium]|nr:histidine kinase [Lachnospiraceae bacterium]